MPMIDCQFRSKVTSTKSGKRQRRIALYAESVNGVGWHQNGGEACTILTSLSVTPIAKIDSNGLEPAIITSNFFEELMLGDIREEPMLGDIRRLPGLPGLLPFLETTGLCSRPSPPEPCPGTSPSPSPSPAPTADNITSTSSNRSSKVRRGPWFPNGLLFPSLVDSPSSDSSSKPLMRAASRDTQLDVDWERAVRSCM